jgi:hypothetical protein
VGLPELPSQFALSFFILGAPFVRVIMFHKFHRASPTDAIGLGLYRGFSITVTIGTSKFPGLNDLTLAKIPRVRENENDVTLKCKGYKCALIKTIPMIT